MCPIKEDIFFIAVKVKATEKNYLNNIKFPLTKTGI